MAGDLAKSIASLYGADGWRGCFPRFRRNAVPLAHLEYRPRRWDDITDEERTRAYADFCRHQRRRDARDGALTVVWRIFSRVVLPLLLIAWGLYNIPAMKRVRGSYPAIEWDRGSGEVLSETTVTLEGWENNYLLKDDVYRGEIAVDGFEPADLMFGSSVFPADRKFTVELTLGGYSQLRPRFAYAFPRRKLIAFLPDVRRVITDGLLLSPMERARKTGYGTTAAKRTLHRRPCRNHRRREAIWTHGSGRSEGD